MSVQQATRQVRNAAMACGCLATLLLGITGALHAQATEPAPVGTGVIIPIHTEITDITADSVRRRISEARAVGATTIIFELDTPGGLVTSTFNIADQIRNLTDIKTVAWVNTTAHSGGAIVAIACEEIVTARSSRIGDAQVIFGNPIGAEAVPEELKPKITTPVLGDVRASAQLRGYSKVLCESFVDPDREVWWLENIESGEREFVFRDEKLKRLGETETQKTDSKEENAEATEKKETATAKSEDGDSQVTEAPKWKLVEKYFDIVLGTEVDAVQPVVRDDQLLQMSASEAHAYGFSKGIVADDDALIEHYGLAAVTRLASTWSELFALWMTSMWVRGFLLAIIMLGAYVEFHTPGVGVPGLVALICLAIFVGAPYLAGLANVWEILFIVLGFGLMALEIFVIPGFGVAGISGLILVAVGVLSTFVPDELGETFPLYIPSLPSTIRGLQIGMITMVSSMVASLIGMVVLSRYLPRMPMFRRIVPANPTPSEVAVADPYHGLARVGDVGQTAGPLHPAGKAHFGSELVDVVTQGELLDAGQQVEVIERRGNRVVVRAVAT
jgi:membrane-bound serine protease (ClpP class)